MAFFSKILKSKWLLSSLAFQLPFIVYHCFIKLIVLSIPVVDFFNRINLIYGAISEVCTDESCPTMSGGKRFVTSVHVLKVTFLDLLMASPYSYC